MALTTYGLFSSTANVGGLQPWQNTDNILTEDANFSNVGVTVGNSDILEAYTPLSGSEVPSGAKIVAINVEVNWDADSDSLLLEPFIDTRQSYLTSNDGVPTTDTIEGDLAYWGLTESEAQDVADGTTPLKFYAPEETVGGSVVRIYWTKMQFEYVQVIPAPVMF